MFIRKLASTDAFVAVDLGDVPGHGVVRLAPKILQGGAKDLARSVTYALASLEHRETGISAGVNSTPDGRDAAIAAFAAEVAEWDAGYRLTAGKGVAVGELGDLETPSNAVLLATGAVAAGLAACPDAGTAVVDGSAGPALLDELTRHGLSLVEAADPLTATADLLFVGSKVGAIDHGVADQLRVRAVVPTGPLPLTTRAVAHCRRNGVLALPDFVTTAGPLVGEVDAVRDTVSTIIGDVLGHGDGPILGACERAEAFMAGWLTDLPFGRPIAA